MESTHICACSAQHTVAPVISDRDEMTAVHTMHLEKEEIELMEDIALVGCFPPESKAQFLVKAILRWIRRGEKSVLVSGRFSEKERIALIGSVNTLIADPLDMSPRNLALQVLDYIELDEGAGMDFSKEESDCFARRIDALSYPEAYALFLWAKRFWTKNEENEDETSLEEYVK